MLELELHARRQERGALQQAGDHRVGALADEAAEPLGDAGIFFGEFARLFVKQLQFAVVEVEKFPVHCLQPVDLNLAAVELDVGNEFDRNIDRLAAKVGAYDEADFEVARLDVGVAGRPGSSRGPGAVHSATTRSSTRPRHR